MSKTGLGAVTEPEVGATSCKERTLPKSGAAMLERRAAAAGLAGALAVLAVLALVAGPGVSSSGSTELLELGEEPRTDLRIALALEVSKKRFNKAQKKLEELHQEMAGDFEGLKKWTKQKEEARAQLEKVIAENDPSMEIDKSRTAEYAAPPAVARSSGLHLSSARDAKVERASHLPARAVAVPAPKAAPRTDRVAKRFNAEMGDMIEAQKKTQGEVSALAQQMKTMMGRQVIRA